MSDETIAAIRAAWLEHLVMFFRDQTLEPAQLLALARRFGEPVEYPFVKGLEGFPQITPVIKLEHEKINFGGLWHSDTAYLDKPPMATMLIARETPPRGGDTLFANMYLAYETLSDGLRRLLDGLDRGELLRQGGRHAHARGPHAATARRPTRRRNTTPSIRWCARIPRPAARRSTSMAATPLRFKDMSAEESAPLLNYLFAHMMRPEFTCRFRWEPGSIALWDNRCTQHNPVNDYHGFRRVMHRVTLAGDVPH